MSNGSKDLHRWNAYFPLKTYQEWTCKKCGYIVKCFDRPDSDLLVLVIDDAGSRTMTCDQYLLYGLLEF